MKKNISLIFCSVFLLILSACQKKEELKETKASPQVKAVITPEPAPIPQSLPASQPSNPATAPEAAPLPEKPSTNLPPPSTGGEALSPPDVHPVPAPKTPSNPTAPMAPQTPSSPHFNNTIQTNNAP